MVNDLCKQHSLSMPRHPGPAPKLGLSELLTLALFGQWARFPSEQAFYRFAQRHLKAAFPMLPDHSQFVRGEHACAQLIKQIACLLASLRLDGSVTDDELAALNLLRDPFHGEWNYTIKPQLQ